MNWSIIAHQKVLPPGIMKGRGSVGIAAKKLVAVFVQVG